MSLIYFKYQLYMTKHLIIYSFFVYIQLNHKLYNLHNNLMN